MQFADKKCLKQNIIGFGALTLPLPVLHLCENHLPLPNLHL